MGLACGWATLATGGLGAAMIGHAVTSFAVFVFTGHAGQVPPAGNEPEEVELRRQIPAGWQDTRRQVAATSAAGESVFETIGPSGYGERSAARQARRTSAVPSNRSDPPREAGANRPTPGPIGGTGTLCP